MATPSKALKIGKYDVIDTIGRGGMGVVYRAKDPFLGRLVAIKMINVDINESADFLERFRQEAVATAGLPHPNIVTVYDWGEHQGHPYLVMQYLEGSSLEALLRAHRPMSLLEKISIIIEVCQGLGYAHQHGIIHRDIKPANIMVLNDGTVKIVDFGIARLGDRGLTKTGQIVGSLNYMPPEQIREKGIDTRADIYSTGVVLYQLLTYALPFEGDSTVSTLAKIISDEPPPFRQFGISCPPELEAITLKALAKNRDQRYATAEDLAAALAELQNRLKQESIREFLSKAELLQQNNELVQAQEYLLKVQKLDRQNTMAARLLGSIREKLQAQLSAERARQFRQQAEEAVAREDFDNALMFIGQAIELDNRTDLRTLRAGIEQAKADAEMVRKAIARAEQAQRTGDLDSAKNAIDSAFSRRPNDSKVKALRRAIERDLEERDRQLKVEGLLDESRKYMSARKFTAALDVLREAQKLDPSAPQLRALLEKLQAEHQHEKRSRELEQLNREVQDAIDRDDYKNASAKAAEALQKFPGDVGLTRLKEIADEQMAAAAQKEYVRNQTAAAQQFLDSGETQSALDAVEKALQKAPGNARLESIRTLIQDRILKERTEADKATCLRQANEAIRLGRYPDAIQILESAQVRFVDSKDIDERLHFVREQQAKARREAFVEEAMRSAQRLLAEHDFEGTVALLEKAVAQVPSEDLDLLLRQAREQRDGFRRDLQAAIAKGKSLLDEGSVASAREFLNSRPATYRQSREFKDLLDEARNTPIPPPPVETSESDATKFFSQAGFASGSATVIEPAPTGIRRPQVEPEPVRRVSQVRSQPVIEEPREVEVDETIAPPPRSRTPLLIGVAALALIVIGAVVWWLMPGPPKQAYLNIQTNPGAQVLIDGTAAPAVGSDGKISVSAKPGTHEVRVTLDGYKPYSRSVTLRAGEQYSVDATLEVTVNATLPPIFGTLALSSKPAEADVFVDGQRKDATGHNGKLSLQLEPGTHKIQLKKFGYEDSPEQSVEVAANKEKSLPPFSLKKEKETKGTAILELASIPPGASVRIDDRAAGTTPFKAPVPPGSHIVQFTKEGYVPETKSVSVKEGETLPVRTELHLPVVPAEIKQFSATPETIQQGHSTKLTWATQNATEVTIEPGIGRVEPSGSRDVSPNDNQTYTLTAKWNGGSPKTQTTHVTVEAPPIEPPRITAFGPEQTIEKGSKAKLKWETQNATEVSIDGSAVAASGEKDVEPSETTTYRLTAKGKGGKEATATVRVTVNAPTTKPVETTKNESTGVSGRNSADEQGVNDALTAYKEAYESMSLAVLKNRWVGMSKEQENAIKQQFGHQNIKAMKMRETDCSGPKITGDAAEMSCSEIKTFTVAGQPPEPGKPQPFQFLFIRQKNGKWILDKKAPK